MLAEIPVDLHGYYPADITGHPYAIITGSPLSQIIEQAWEMVEWRCRKQSAPVEPRHECVAKVAPPGTLQLPQAREWGSQICCSSERQTHDKHLVLASCSPYLWPVRTFGMSERNDTMAAHRSVVKGLKSPRNRNQHQSSNDELG